MTIRPAYAIPPKVADIADQMYRRDTGICESCGLEQSFYLFTDDGRRRIYDLGLEVMSAGNRFGEYPPAPEWLGRTFENNYAARLRNWDALFGGLGASRFRRVLHLRCQYGEAGRYFAQRYGAEVWGMESTKTCERYVREHVPEIRLLDGNLSGLIEIDHSERGLFDLIICFHILTHSVAMRRDMDTLKELLAPGGYIIFCDEISKKFLNPFHIVHTDERWLTRALRAEFGEVHRVDECGMPAPHVTKFTVKGDSPDLVVRSSAA
ncbi:MAG: class I SAM-dependent methyltransferase [Gemmatimonadaceae bacterium]